MDPVTATTVGLTIADKILNQFGVDPLKIGEKILAGGDKKRRLDQIEMLGNATAMHIANMLKATEGLPPEQRLAIQDGLLLTATQTIGIMVKAADVDGSSST